MPTAAKNPGTWPSPRQVAAASSEDGDDLMPLRYLVFLYIFLWVFEGALRKWIVPGLANPLLVVRDPVLLLMYALAYAKGVFPKMFFIPWIAGLGLLATLLSVATTVTPLAVTLFGIRANYLHLPLIFLLPEILRRKDLWTIGLGFLLAGIFMGMLVVLQFRASAGSFLNAGAGENTTMLESAFGHVRPSGTFSYTNGLTGFMTLVAAFFLQHLLEKRLFPRLVFLATAPALLAMVILSGSRLAAGVIAILLATVVIISVVQRRYWASSLKLIALVAAAAVVAGSLAVFQSGLQVFSSRFESNRVEQRGLSGRYLDSFAQPFRVVERADWNGVGIGMGTNVAAGLLTGQRKFMFSEGEGGRIIMESGPVVGFAYLMLRLCIVVYIGAQAVRALRLHAATLPLLLFSGCFNDLLIGQFSQATALGYATITGGLCLAACRVAGEPRAEEANREAPTLPKTRRSPVGKAVIPAKPDLSPTVAALSPAPDAKPATAASPAKRGRSAYAERLHRQDVGDPPP